MVTEVAWYQRFSVVNLLIYITDSVAFNNTILKELFYKEVKKDSSTGV